MPTTGNSRFVATKAVHATVRGRETDILDALGIPWRQGRPHIRCPYPDHIDNNPSWRWDPKRDCAFCTCQGSKADGIFDIVMKVRCLDFEAAKILVAELLHREDLIKTKSGNVGATWQKTDPQSLLNPPADNRNDELAYRYLAARLGIAVDQVPRPSTQMVGIASLAYFDPAGQTQKERQAGAGHACTVRGVRDHRSRRPSARPAYLFNPGWLRQGRARHRRREAARSKKIGASRQRSAVDRRLLCRVGQSRHGAA